MSIPVMLQTAPQKFWQYIPFIGKVLPAGTPGAYTRPLIIIIIKNHAITVHKWKEIYCYNKKKILYCIIRYSSEEDYKIDDWNIAHTRFLLQ